MEFTETAIKKLTELGYKLELEDFGLLLFSFQESKALSVLLKITASVDPESGEPSIAVLWFLDNASTWPAHYPRETAIDSIIKKHHISVDGLKNSAAFYDTVTSDLG